MRVAHSVWLTETRLSYRAQTPSEVVRWDRATHQRRAKIAPLIWR